MSLLLKWTVADYHRMIAAGILSDRPVELLAGEIYEMPPEGPPHSFYGGSLADYFRECLGKRALVREARPITLATTSH
jgi:Uma2 family endonuclease